MTPIGQIREIATYNEHVSYICTNSVGTYLTLPNHNVMHSYKRSPVWVISGRGETDTNGLDKIDINSCLYYPICDGRPTIADKPTIINDHPIMIVTPQTTSEPIILTANSIVRRIPPLGNYYCDILNYTPIEGQIFDYEVIFEVKSWKLDGQPAGKVVFSWLCIAEAAVAVTVV